MYIILRWQVNLCFLLALGESSAGKSVARTISLEIPTVFFRKRVCIPIFDMIFFVFVWGSKSLKSIQININQLIFSNMHHTSQQLVSIPGASHFLWHLQGHRTPGRRDHCLAAGRFFNELLRWIYWNILKLLNELIVTYCDELLIK